MKKSPDDHLQNHSPPWSVWRQDDSGTKFLMGARLTEAEATAMVADFEARGHKQTYWCAIASGPES